jgi:hypothetical protein
VPISDCGESVKSINNRLEKLSPQTLREEGVLEVPDQKIDRMRKRVMRTMMMEK